MERKAIWTILKDHVNSNGRQALQSQAGGLSKTPKGGCDSFVIEYCDRRETKPTTWARTGTGSHGSARKGT